VYKRQSFPSREESSESVVSFSENRAIAGNGLRLSPTLE